MLKNIVFSNSKYYLIYFNTLRYNILSIKSFIFFSPPLKYYFFIIIFNSFYSHFHLFLYLSLCISLFSQTHCKTQPTITSHTHTHWHKHHHQQPQPSATKITNKDKNKPQTPPHPPPPPKKKPIKFHTHPPSTTNCPPQTIPTQNQITNPPNYAQIGIHVQTHDLQIETQGMGEGWVAWEKAW